MSCFPCFTSQRSKKSNSKREHGPPPQEQVITRTPDIKRPKPDDPSQVDTSNIQAHNFTFRELATATKNFRQECLTGEGGFGRVYKGTIPATGQVVAVKQLDRNGMQGSKEFLVEVLMLSLLNHDNLVKLTGYCADGDQRLLVYEFMPGGSLERRLLERGPDQPPLDWYSRMKIASHAAKGLWYLHDKANPPVIYRDLKSSNILLDDDHNAKLSDYGLAKLAGKDKMNIVPTRVMGTYGYSAPEYVRTGNLTLKSDVYSFGVVLLELITGRRAIDTTRPNEEQNLVSWAQPIFRDPKRYPDMADPLLKNQFPEKDLNQVVAIAAMCLQEESAARPLMSDVVTALSFLSTSPPEVVPAPLPPATSAKSAASESGIDSESESESDKDSHSSDEEGSRHDHNNETASNHVAGIAKYQDCDDASDAEYDYYENENQPEYSPQDIVESKEFHSKSSRKSSTRSRNESVPSSDSEDEKVLLSSNQKSSTKHLSQKSSQKFSVRERDLSQKSSKKTSLKDRDLIQKSSKKSSVKDRELSQKSSKKSSARVLSHKRSTGMGSEEGSTSSRGNVSLSRNSSSSSEESHDGGAAMFEHRYSSQGNVSFGIRSSESGRSDHDSNTRSQEGSSRHFDHNSSRGSDVRYDRGASMGSSEEGSFHHYDRASSRGSYEASVHS